MKNVNWIASVLDDMVEFAENNELPGTAKALTIAIISVQKEIENKQTGASKVRSADSRSIVQ